MDGNIADVVTQVQSQADLWFHKQIYENDFLIGGVATVMLGSLGYALRRVPGRIADLFLHIFTIELAIPSDSEAFFHTMRYLERHRIPWLQRKFMSASQHTGPVEPQSNDDGPFPKWPLGPGFGNLVSRYGSKIIVGRLIKEESQSWNFKMALHLRFFGRSGETARRFLDEVRLETMTLGRRGISVLTLAEGWWHEVVTNKRRRSLDSVFIKAEDKNKLIERITWFYANEQWYRTRGLPYKMGIMLTGVPGTGKSSIIHALASHFDKDMRLMNLNSLSDSRLHVLSALSRMDMLVIEDIDTFKVSNRRKIKVVPDINGNSPAQPMQPEKEEEQTGVSLSTVLNLLDGPLSAEGVVTIATTNHLDNIDEAVKRKGRFDLTIEITALDGPCLVEMFAAFYGEEYRSMVQEFVDSGWYQPAVGALAQDLFRHEPPDVALQRLSSRPIGLINGENHASPAFKCALDNVA